MFTQVATELAEDMYERRVTKKARLSLGPASPQKVGTGTDSAATDSQLTQHPDRQPTQDPNCQATAVETGPIGITAGSVTESDPVLLSPCEVLHQLFSVPADVQASSPAHT